MICTCVLSPILTTTGRRVERERAKAADSGKRELVLPLLDVVDGFDRALAHATKVPAGILEGFQAIHRNLLDLLQGHGVTPLSASANPSIPRSMKLSAR